jgi:phospholipid/cholesterol/gamma-HCH transport system substrate-binding protein
MNTSRTEWKVGLFLLLSLGFAAALIMKFSKSSSVFQQTYDILMVTSNVGGIRPGASVLMAGVQVGTVRSIDLDGSGKIVTLHVQVQARYHIHADARFTIEQAGFLGDQYISITPGANQTAIINPGETVRVEEPFNLQEVARSAAGLLRRVDQTAARLNEAVSRIDQTILAEQTLTNLAVLVGNFRVVSDKALSTVDEIDAFVQTNTPPLSTAVSNLVSFSDQLDAVTEELQLTIRTNRIDITAAVQNIQKATLQLNGLLRDLEQGKGLAGGLLKDEELRRQFSQMMSNLNVVSSNLSHHGLWWNLFAKRRPPTSPPPQPSPPAYTGKLP